jgi:serine/threonine protein kinase/formylglycine-generating enzyme required for sulfatase activity/predicted esterase
MSDAARVQRIKELYNAALDLTVEQRAAFLVTQCGGDDSLRHEIESLLAYETRAGHFIETPALQVAAALVTADLTQHDQSPKAESLVGRHCGAYKIIAPLGAGGMGEVYLAKDTRLGRRVALKLLPARFNTETERVRRFEKEARAASSLNHPNIVTVYEIGEAAPELGSQRFIVTEFIEGETLRQRLGAGALPPATALDYAAQVAAALTAAHEAGIIHRDIKPENLMLRRDGYVKVLDFGLAKLSESTPAGYSTLHTQAALTSPGMVMGTARYMSPEQARGLDVDARSDLWSLGVVLYEMLAGMAPFIGATTSDVIAQILTSSPQPLRRLNAAIPADLERLVTRALAKKPEDRFASAEEMLGELRRLREEISFAAKLKEHSGRMAIALSGFSWRALAENLRAPSRKLLVVLSATVVVSAVSAWWSVRFYQQRQARQMLLRLEQLANEQKHFEAYDLARVIAQRLPEESAVVRLMATISDKLNVTSEPAGARVSLRRYGQTPNEFIGVTPVKDAAFARGEYILTIEKEGYAPAERSISSTLTRTGNALVPPDEPSRFHIQLVKADAQPDRMVFVPGGDYKLTSRTRPTEKRVKLGDFFMDKYEVTNREYKEFIAAGGYFKLEYWRTHWPQISEADVKPFRDRTGLPGPRSWSGQDFPAGQAEHPVTDITWHEAAAYAAFRGKQLPTIFQWEKAARNGIFTYYMGYVLPWGAVEFGGSVEGHANFNGRSTAPVHEFAFGMSPFGAYQMAGNVAEWCLNETSDGHIVAGGAWSDPYYLFTNIGAFPARHSSTRLGFRCVRNLTEAKDNEGTMRFETNAPPPVYQPTSEQSFKAILEHFRYDHLPLNAQVVETIETSDWRREKIAYLGGQDERALAYLYLPKNASPPFQVITYVSAGDVYGGFSTAYESAETQVPPFIKAGRAVLTVVFKGFKEREHPPDYTPVSWRTVRRRAEVVRNATDLRRGLDYLATRQEFDMSRVAYFGFSQGAMEGIMYVAVEPRFRTAVYVAGHMPPAGINWIAEASPQQFAAHIQAPVLMLNGRYDEVNPLRTHIEPLYQLLRAPKQLYLYDSGHSPPFEIAVPVINQWLDEKLSPIKR